MQFSKFVSLVMDWQKQEVEVMNKKAHDYASSDTLSNFKRTAVVADVSVEKVFLVMLGIKLCRLTELTGGKEAKNESVEDTISDAKNYLTLLKAYLYEKNNGQ